MDNKHGLQTIVLTVFLLLARWIVLAPMALAQTPFYEGKNVLLVSGTDAGGAGDLRTRAVIPVLKKHIPATLTSLCSTCRARADARRPITCTRRFGLMV